MPIYRGVRLNDYIIRLAWVAAPIGSTQWYQTWPSAAYGNMVTTGAAPSWGAWQEMISAASAPTSPFTVTHVGMSDNAHGTGIAGFGCYEIGTGSAGSEKSVAYGGFMGASTTSVFPLSIPTPLPIIPGGTRVAIRMMSVAGTEYPYMKVATCLLPKPMNPQSLLSMAAKFSSYYPGPTAMTAENVTLTAGNAAFTYGSYGQIYAAATETNPVIIREVYLQPGSAFGQVVFATGGVGSEVAWGEFNFCGEGASTTAAWSIPLPIPLLVPGSTRHAAKVWANTAGVTISYPGLSFSKGLVLP